MAPCGEESFFEGGMEKKNKERQNYLTGKMKLKIGCKYSCNSIWFGLLV